MAVEATSQITAARITEAWALQRQGQDAEAAAVYRDVLRHQPDQAQALHNLGLLAVKAGDVSSGIEMFCTAIQHEPNNPRFHTNLAQTLRSVGRFEEAVAAADRALASQADFANAVLCRAQAYLALTQYAPAAADFVRATALGLTSAEILQQYGQSLSGLRRHGEALTVFDQAVSLQPNNADARNHRGVALFQLGRYAEALADCDAAIALRDDVPSYWNNRGNVQVAVQRFDQAILDYDRAVALKPDYPDPYVNKGIALLQLGNFAHGWFYFEWRWKRGEAKKCREFKQPLWLGKTDLRGKTIFLHSEQGLGDTIQFFRYAELVRQRGAIVFLGVQQPLKSLIQHALPEITVYAEGEIIPPFDVQCPLMSLPLACGTRTPDNIPPTPRLSAPEPLRQIWAECLGDKTRPRVGLAWAGNPEHLNDHNRSLPLACLEPLTKLAVDFICLQKSITPPDREVLRAWGVADYAEELTDFTATAALIGALDLVITVDTSVAHLAGAMGKPVWLLLPRNPDFRWLLGREDSPWYPSLRIFRQAECGGWAALVARVRAAIDDILNSAVAIT